MFPLVIPILLAAVLFTAIRQQTQLQKLLVNFEDRQSFLAILIPALDKAGFVPDDPSSATITFRTKRKGLIKTEIVTEISPSGSAAIFSAPLFMNQLKAVFPGGKLEQAGHQPKEKVRSVWLAAFAIWVIFTLVLEVAFHFLTHL